MKPIGYITLSLFLLIVGGCITEFVPRTDEDPNLLVVEGLITDQPEVYSVKLSRSMPLGKTATIKPLKGCTVSIKDDLGNTYWLTESSTAGTYLTDKAIFKGVVGRKYTLHINTNNSTATHRTYESRPMELRAVPAIDSLYYEKVIIQEKTEDTAPEEGCQVYLNTHDSQEKCKFYRWDYVETWKFQLPYFVPNQTCWITSNSNEINIKNTSVLSEDKVTRFPLKFISNETDRLNVRYSILVNQYSVSEEEFTYWEKLQNISEDIGGLYDIIPSTIPGNMFCVEDPAEQVLGYFSVSARASKRIYIDENFRGMVNLYWECPADTVSYGAPLEGLNNWVWVIVENQEEGWEVITYTKGCADCTVRGTTTKPDFWTDYKK
jgi:hypothetical protein